MPRSSAVALAIASAVLLGGCAAVHELDSVQNEKMLRSAGFRVVAADSPQRIEALKSLAPGKISRVGHGATIDYVYADPYECRCLWVGDEEKYARYRRLQVEAMTPEIELIDLDGEPAWAETSVPW